MKRARRKGRVRPGTLEKAAPRSPREHPLGSGRAWWISAGLVLLNVLVFGPMWRYGFVTWDDPQYITQNPFVAQGLTAESIAWAFTTGYAFYWHPLTWISHMLDIQLYGFEAGGHHITNLVLHMASTVILFAVLRSMTGAMWRSAFVAALFAVHPLRVESVAWIAERKDVLSTLFWMLTLWAYAAYVRSPARGRFLAVLGFFAAGLMAKPMLVTLPFGLMLLDVWPLRRDISLRRSVVEKLPLMGLAVASSVVTFLTQNQMGAVAALEALPVTTRLANALVSYAAYIGMMFWPVNLAALYPFLPLAAWKVAVAVVVLAAISAVAWRFFRSYPYLLVGWLWYLGTLVPVIGLIQSGGQSMADRFTYVPMIGLFVMVAWGAVDLTGQRPRRQSWLAIAAGLLVVACAAASSVQLRYWSDSVTMWRRALAVTTANWRAHINLGYDLSAQGEGNEAIAEFNEALRIRPDFAEGHNNLGAALAQQGKLADAIPHYLRALELKPDYAEAHGNLGVALATQGRTDQAIREFLESLRINPNQADTHSNVAVMYEDKAQIPEAIEHFRAALRLNPRHAEARRSLEKLTGGK